MKEKPAKAKAERRAGESSERKNNQRAKESEK